MPDAESKSWTFLKGVGGVAGGVLTAVLTAVLIHHFTQNPQGDEDPRKRAPQVQLGLAGFVKDAATSKVISGAMVRVGLGPNVAAQDTDTQGQYSFILSGASPTGNQIVVAVQASGYQQWTGTYNLPAGPRFADVSIVPLPAPVPPGPPASTEPTAVSVTPAAATAKLTFRAPPPALHMRAATTLVIPRR